MARIFSAALIGAVALVVQAQSPRDTPSPTTGTGSISGRVVSAETGDPVRKTRVTVEAADAPRVTPVFSDAEGRFAIEGLSPARYIVTAAKPGFIRTKSARVDVTAGAQVGGMELRMPRSASISGRVVDENGEPLVMANVSAETTDGRITREVAATLTNDLGEYRLGNLTAGS